MYREAEMMPLIGRRSLDKAIDNLVSEQNEKVKAVWIQGLKAIITATPVHFDQGGQLRNSWYLTENTPTNENGRNAQGNSANGSYQSVDKMPNFVLGKKLFFTNPMPYANTIEYGLYPNPVQKGTWTGNAYQKLSVNGYSKQAPSGIVRNQLIKMANKL